MLSAAKTLSRSSVRLTSAIKACSSPILMQRNRVMPIQTVATMRDFSTNIGDKLKGKEKVEEERYVRDLEMKFIEKKRAEKQLAVQQAELEHFEKELAPIMAKVQTLLEKTGDKVSDAGLEALARWKSE